MKSPHCTEDGSQTKSATEPWNKEERIIRNKKQGLDLMEPWITTVGGEEVNNAALFFRPLSGDVCSYVWYFVHSRIFWGAFWRDALCCVFFFPRRSLKFHWFPWSLGRGGELQTNPAPAYSLWSQQGVYVNQNCPDVTACASRHVGVTWPKEMFYWLIPTSKD